MTFNSKRAAAMALSTAFFGLCVWSTHCWSGSVGPNLYALMAVGSFLTTCCFGTAAARRGSLIMDKDEMLAIMAAPIYAGKFVDIAPFLITADDRAAFRRAAVAEAEALWQAVIKRPLDAGQ